MRAESSSGEAAPRTRRTGTAVLPGGWLWCCWVPGWSPEMLSVIGFARSQGDVPMLLGWQSLALVDQRAQCPDHPGAGVRRRDHRVDVAAFGGYVGVSERVFVLGDELL